MTTHDQREEIVEPVYWRERDMALDHDHCFLCGVLLDDSNRTDEHVFPRWMQRDFDLWNEELNLLNGTRIRYRALKIPCCDECNGYWLSQVEAVVAEAFRGGPDAVRRLDSTILSLWMAKLYYGIHFKELALLADRRDPNGPTIVSPERIEQFAELHHVLQALRKHVEFTRPVGSVRIFEAQVPEHPQHRFDYRDIRPIPYLAVRVGATVVVASLLDWGAMSSVTAPTFEAAEKIELHPSQFNEVAAFGAYIVLLFNREFAYLVHRDGDHDVVDPVIVEHAEGADPARPVHDPFVLEDYARLLAEFTGLELDTIFDADTQQLWTGVRDGEGTPITLTLEQAPVGTTVIPPGWAG